jgi:hypothetical protein
MTASPRIASQSPRSHFVEIAISTLLKNMKMKTKNKQQTMNNEQRTMNNEQ